MGIDTSPSAWLDLATGARGTAVWCLGAQSHSGGHSLAAFSGVEPFLAGVVCHCRGNLGDEVLLLRMPLSTQLLPDTLLHVFVFQWEERDEIVNQVLLDQLALKETTWKREHGGLCHLLAQEAALLHALWSSLQRTDTHTGGAVLTVWVPENVLREQILELLHRNVFSPFQPSPVIKSNLCYLISTCIAVRKESHRLIRLYLCCL